MYMKKIIFSIIVLSLMAAGCQRVELKREVPSSPEASYEQLPN